MRALDKDALGVAGEQLAERRLAASGLRILERNWRTKADGLRGELDLIAVDETVGTLVVCEVKTRRDAGHFGGAVAAVDYRKQARLRALTGAYLRQSTVPYPQVRLDVVAIDLGRSPSLVHIEAAV